MVCKFYLLKEPAFSFIDLCYCLHHLFFILFCSDLYDFIPSSNFSSVQSLSRVLTLCNPVNCSTPGVPVHHQLLKLTQTHVRRVGDAIQLSHPLFSSCLQSFPETGSCNVGDQSLIPWREDLLEKKITAHSNILSWKIPWMEEPSGLTVAKSWT